MIASRFSRTLAQPIAAVLALVTALAAPASAAEPAAEAAPTGRDLSRDKTLYCVGYAHLDTQWRWDFTTTIDRFLLDTLDDNFERIDAHPGYVFNFTGSARYGMMKEYYPERYQRLKGYIAAGRWFVSGSSVDEGDVNVPSAEAVLRQVLYGNQFFRREFGKESIDFMLPDCFGFPASMPSIWAHAGLAGFSTQKLSWGSAVGIPFPLGRWIGPDGRSVVAALDPGAYVGGVDGRVDLDPKWVERVEHNGREYGVFADYHYYGVGDQGGAPREKDVINYLASVDNPDSRIQVVLGASDQLFRDLTPAQAARLPSYAGDMLLTEHSAGTLTSQAAMKRWNRKGELLADAAERAATVADWLGAGPYPLAKMGRHWERLLLNQMHDILPGTSIPRAYTFSWNDEILALNGFAAVLTNAVAGIGAGLDTSLDTSGDGLALVVVNPLAIEREDPVEAEVRFDGPTPEAVAVIGPDGEICPSQIIARSATTMRVLFLARVPAVGFAVFTVRPAATAWAAPDGPRASDDVLENSAYRLRLDAAGDVVSIVDKEAGDRELLRAPARLVFTREKPRSWPAWNMDWADRQRPPVEYLGGPAKIRILETGPVRATIEVTRTGRNSTVVQRLALLRGDAARRIEFATAIDWQSAAVALRASFPLTVSHPRATYNWGLGTIERGNNDPTKYEVPSHEWFDLTDAKGDYGVSILEDCKFGSDKPDDGTVRLTLLYSPGVRKQYQDQHSQDWGRHQLTYALVGHRGDWREGRSEWQGRRLNQPLKAFQVPRHPGPLGRSFGMVTVSTPQVDVRALKRSEDGRHVILRLQELWGRPTGPVEVVVGTGIAAGFEVDGQERRIDAATVRAGKLVVEFDGYSPRSFALELQPPPARLAKVRSESLALPFDVDVVSSDGDSTTATATDAGTDAGMDDERRTLPAEMLPARIDSDGVSFVLGPTTRGADNAVACRGQRLTLPEGDPASLHLLAAAAEDVEARFGVGSDIAKLRVQSWTGFIGQWDDRVWDREFAEVDHETAGHVVGFRPGFIHRAPVAWFATHRHHPKHGNEAYRFSYLYALRIPLAPGAKTVTLPDDPRVKVLAATAAWDGSRVARPAAALYDDYDDRAPIELRHVYPPPPLPVFEGVAPTGLVTIDRAETFADLKMGAPVQTDFVDAARGRHIDFVFHDGGGEWQPHWAAGADNHWLPRLNDGEVSLDDDDTRRSVWYDSEGRFSVDLGQAMAVARVNTYSWHRHERAPQWFSLWGSASATMPRPDFQHGDVEGWTLLAVVDTRAQGQGGIQGSSVTFSTPVRHLLWVAQDVGNGTFFTEIDIHVPADAP